MRIAYVADVHVANHRKHGGPTRAGINRRGMLVLEALADAVDHANSAGADLLVIAGDLFDAAKPEPQLASATMGVLRKFRHDVLVLPGNHDIVSTTAGDHALGPLGHLDNVLVLEKPHVSSRGSTAVMLVPFRPGNTSEWLSAVVEQLAAERDDTMVAKHTHLVLHAGIADEKTARWLQGAHDSIGAMDLDRLMQAHDIDLAVAGNWHDHRSWETYDVTTGRARRIVQCGALVPTGFNNPGLAGYGSVILAEGDGSWHRHEVPGPRFVSVGGDFAREQYLEAAGQVASGRLFVQWKEKAGRLAGCSEQLRADELMHGLGGVEAVPDAQDHADAKAEAVRGALAAQGWDAALGAYVDSMPLEAGVDRAAVLARAKTYLTR